MQNFTSLVIIEFDSKKMKDNILSWLLEEFDLKGLLIKQVPRKDGDKNFSIHIGAGSNTLLQAAELMQIKKKLKDGSVRVLNYSHLNEFDGGEDRDSLLTMSEKQQIILHEIQSVRAKDKTKIERLGLNKLLYDGQAVVPLLLNKGYIKKIFPLHDREELKRLGTDWYKTFIKKQPIETIRNYFGETIALYFSFLGFYTYALIPPAAFGVISYFFPTNWLYTTVFFSAFNLIWCTFFLELWKRYCSKLTYEWGTYGTERLEEARPEYYGKLGINKITNRIEPKYPKYKRLLRFYGVSVPIVFLCLVIAFYAMLFYFWMQNWADNYYANDKGIVGFVVVNLPSAVYAIQIAIMNALYRILAKKLNDWENHRLQSAYNNHLIVKLILFDSVNCFMSLFYVAFYLQNMPLLRSHLATLLIVSQIIGQAQETLLPYILYKRRKIAIRKVQNKTAMEDEHLLKEAINQADIEKDKDLYIDTEGTMNDYLEMYLQFGYVFLFSAVFPTAAVWAFMNNLTEIRSDAFKLCRIMQRPFSVPAANLGAWQIAFEILSLLAVLTNTALIGLSSPVHDKLIPRYGEGYVILAFVLLEHVILGIKAVVSFCIPDAPKDVLFAIAKTNYENRLAWQDKRKNKNSHTE